MEASILNQGTNIAIIKLPGRAFPSIAIQGDSLSVIASQGRYIKEHLGETTDENLAEEVKDLCDKLGSLLEYYEKVTAKYGYDLPYHK